MSVHFDLFKSVSSVVTPSTRSMREDQSHSIGYQLLGDSSNVLRLINECLDVSELPTPELQLSYLRVLLCAKEVFEILQGYVKIDVVQDVPAVQSAIMALMNWVIEHQVELVCGHHQGLVKKVMQHKAIIEERAKAFNHYGVERLKAQDRVGLFATSSLISDQTTDFTAQAAMNMS